MNITKYAIIVTELISTLLLFIVGVIANPLILELWRNGIFLPLQTWWQYWIIAPLLFLLMLIFIYQRFIRSKIYREEQIYYALKWFYDDMGFEILDSDIRCTIWVPKKSNEILYSTKLQQVVDYVPRKSKLSNQTFRVNGKAKRTVPIYKKVRNEEQAIGILGQCAISCLNHHSPLSPLTIIGSVPDKYKDKLPDFMVKNFHFSLNEAKLLTPDRRSYLCVPMMDAGETELLGIVYCDSNSPNSLNTQIGEKVGTYLPRFAELLTM